MYISYIFGAVGQAGGEVPHGQTPASGGGRAQPGEGKNCPIDLPTGPLWVPSIPPPLLPIQKSEGALLLLLVFVHPPISAWGPQTPAAPRPCSSPSAAPDGAPCFWDNVIASMVAPTGAPGDHEARPRPPTRSSPLPRLSLKQASSYVVSKWDTPLAGHRLRRKLFAVLSILFLKPIVFIKALLNYSYF